jgi:1-acyl-sn-glycerol-3-phosphate acyltransferase
LNETRTIAQEKTSNRSQAIPAMFPQWAIETIRPIVRTVSRLCWNIKHSGTENIPEHGGLIIAANHQSYFDPFWISIPIGRPVRYLAWKEAFSWPFVGKIITLLGAWPLQLEGSDPAAIRRSLQWLRDGGVLVIFPEGARGTSNGEMLRFKAGAARLAMDAEVPILPVTIRGGNKVWPRDQKVPRLGQVEIVYHQPVRIETTPGEEIRRRARRETESLAQTIGSALHNY